MPVSLSSCCCVASVVDQKVKIVASPKIPKASDASKHKAGGGNVQICQWKSTSQRCLSHTTRATCATHNAVLRPCCVARGVFS